MTQKELIEKATNAFVENINMEKVMNILNDKKDYLAPWVLALMGTGLPNYVQVSCIIHSLFESAVFEPGEEFAVKSTAKYDEEAGCEDPFGDVIEISMGRRHVWIRFSFGDRPFSRFEISMMDNDR